MIGNLNFVTWLWKGWRNIYTAAHVERLQRMLAETTTGPWTLTCITDQPAGMPCPTIPLWEIAEPVGLEAKAPNCFRRLKCFDPAMKSVLGSSIISIDLDCNIYRDLRPLLDTAERFKCANGHHSYLNGSLWKLDIGYRSDVWFDYDPVKTPEIIRNTRYGKRTISGSDQAWMSIKMPGAPRWTESNGVYQRMHLQKRNLPPNARILFFAGKIKPWDSDCEPQHYRP